MKYVLAAADKAADNVVVVWWLHYLNTPRQELGSAKTYEWISTDKRSSFNTHSIDSTAKFAVGVKENYDKLPMLYWLLKMKYDHLSLIHTYLIFKECDFSENKFIRILWNLKWGQIHTNIFAI